MAAIKKWAANAGAASAALTSSPNDSASGRNSFSTKFSNVRRRLFESTLIALGKDEASSDVEYNAKKEAILKIERLLRSMEKHVKTQADGLRAYASASAGVAADTQFLFGETDVEAFMTALQDIDSSLRAKIDAELCENVLDPIARALASIDVMKADMRVRELSKLDYDSRARKVRELKEKPGSDHKKVAHKEDKLNRTRQTLADLTSALFERMDEFEGNRCSVYGPIMNAYLNAQRKFFSSASAAMTAIPDFPVTDAAKSDEQEAEKPEAAIPKDEFIRAAPVTVSSTTTTSRSSTRIKSPPAEPPRPASSSGGVALAGLHAQRASRALPTDAKDERVKVMFPYTQANADELTLAPGDVIVVEKTHPDGWAVGHKEKSILERGAFPLNYTAPV